jgi:predicted SpoU family rRNA methylase
MEDKLMFVIRKEKKKISVFKIVVLTATVAAAVASVVTALLIWKKKIWEGKKLANDIDAVVDAAFAEEELEEVFGDVDPSEIV